MPDRPAAADRRPAAAPGRQAADKFWHVCPTCGLAGPVDRADGFYCRQHRPAGAEPQRPPDEPPNLHDWIRRYGGYAKIPEEGCADYKRAMAEWDERCAARLRAPEEPPP